MLFKTKAPLYEALLKHKILIRDCSNYQGLGKDYYRIAVKKSGNGIRFLRKIVRDDVDESYGIEVAKLAGLPDKVVKRARELLEEMEQENAVQIKPAEDDGQMSFTAMNRDILADRIRKTNIDELSDEECREFLKELTKLAE